MNMGTMHCTDARPLVPSYLDGELSEAQAGPLRKHLLACQACRAGAQAGKNVKRWFEPTEPVAVPRDFAARVTRLAFAGVEAVAESEEREMAPARTPVAPALVQRAEPAQQDGRILAFVLRLTVAAAVLALLASVAIQSLRRPSSAELRADDRRVMTLDQALDKLDRIEHAEQLGRDARGRTDGSSTADRAR